MDGMTRNSQARWLELLVETSSFPDEWNTQQWMALLHSNWRGDRTVSRRLRWKAEQERDALHLARRLQESNLGDIAVA